MNTSESDALKTFADQVTRMRRNQKEYFRTRSTSALEASKTSERAVDKLLVEIVGDGKQTQLF